MIKKNGDPKTAEVISNHCNIEDSKIPPISKWKISAARSELSAPQHIRLFDAVANNPGCYTWQISRACSIQFPPARIFEINQKISMSGLVLRSVPPAGGETNKFGDPSRSHRWFLSVISGAGVV